MSETETTKAPRMRKTIDVETKILTIGEGVGAVNYDMNALPHNVITYMAGQGLGVALAKHKDPAAKFADFMAGKLPIDRVGKSAEPSRTDQAIALAVRDALAARDGVKKSDKAAFAALLARASEMVASMSKATKDTHRATAQVIAHISSLKAAEAPQLSLTEEA